MYNMYNIVYTVVLYQCIMYMETHFLIFTANVLSCTPSGVNATSTISHHPCHFEDNWSKELLTASFTDLLNGDRKHAK